MEWRKVGGDTMNPIFDRLIAERRAFIEHTGKPPRHFFLSKEDVRHMASCMLFEDFSYIERGIESTTTLIRMYRTGKIEKGATFMGIPLMNEPWGDALQKEEHRERINMEPVPYIDKKGFSKHYYPHEHLTRKE
jgi:hypothetical protein